MSSCQDYQEQLVELAAVGESWEQAPGELRMHLQSCSHCRAEWRRLRSVEAALKAWPAAPLRRDLTDGVMARVAAEPRQVEWNLLPRHIWLPAMAIALVMGLILASHLAGRAPIDALWPVMGVSVSVQPAIEQLRQPLNAAGRELFWAIWCGLFVSAAGLGLGLGLSTGGEQLGQVSDDLKARWEQLRQMVHL